MPDALGLGPGTKPADKEKILSKLKPNAPSFKPSYATVAKTKKGGKRKLRRKTKKIRV